MKKINFIFLLILVLTLSNSYCQNLKYKFTKEYHLIYDSIPKITYQMTESFKAKIPDQPKNAGGISDTIFNYNFKEKAKKLKSEKNYTYLLKLESPGSVHIGIVINYYLPEGSQIKLTSSSGFERVINPEKPELKKNKLVTNGGSSDMLIMVTVPISKDEKFVFDLLYPVYYYR